MSTEAAAPPTTVAPKASSFWEDAIDIFFSPADVFRRREHRSVWPPLLFVGIAVTVIMFFAFNAMQPAFDAEFTRAMAQAAKQTPQLNAGMMDKMRGYQEFAAKYFVGVVMIVTMFVLGAISWLIGKFVGSKQTFHAALVVAAWAYVPRILGLVIGAAQTLFMSSDSLTGQASISLSPARFLNPDTANPLVFQVLLRLDLITLWVTALLGVGLYVTGRVSKQQAFWFAVLMFVVGSLPAIRQGIVAM